MNSFYSQDELSDMGFKRIGSNAMISRKASFYGASNMSIGNNIRIDDFCILSGNITIGNYAHIAEFCSLFERNDGIQIRISLCRKPHSCRNAMRAGTGLSVMLRSACYSCLIFPLSLRLCCLKQSRLHRFQQNWLRMQ